MDILNLMELVHILNITTMYNWLKNDSFRMKNNSHLPEILTTLKPTERQSSSRDKQIQVLELPEMDEPEFFYYLTNSDKFNTNCTDIKKEMLILYNYNVPEIMLDFEDELDEALANYEYYNISSELRFEDYFAIRYYTNFGYKQIKKDSDEGRRMRHAFYALAIIQSRHPEIYFNPTLFRGQSKLKTWYKEHFGGGKTDHELERFTSVSSDKAVGMKYGIERKENSSMTSTLYEMHFPRPFLSANIDNLTMFYNEKETVLLPGTKFFINETIWSKNVSSPIDLIIKVTHDDKNMDLFEQQKNVMSEIKKLRATGTQFYVNC